MANWYWSMSNLEEKLLGLMEKGWFITLEHNKGDLVEIYALNRDKRMSIVTIVEQDESLEEALDRISGM